MAVTAGRAFVLAYESAPSIFTTIAASDDARLTINNTLVSSTTKDDAGVAKLLAAAGETSATISGNFKLDDSASQDALIALRNATTAETFRITAAFGTLTGDFLVSSIDFSGSNNDVQKMSVTLNSTGALTLA